MPGERFEATESWPLQRGYKIYLHNSIQKWSGRVAFCLDKLQDSIPADELENRWEFLEFLASSVERQDSRIANAVQAADGYVREYVEGEGPYGRGGGSIESIVGIEMSGQAFENLYAIYEAGRNHID